MKLAPSGILRGAAWPLSCLDDFGCDELAQLADAAQVGRVDRATFEQAYQTAVERERQCLWRCTEEDVWFSKALALSSPSAYARVLVAAGRRSQPRNRAMRLAEYTLYRYLARAAGRTTPHGLWAGVSDVQFGEHNRIESIPARVDFTPDLRPFQTLLRRLAGDPWYRDRALWGLNPTLQPMPAGGWEFRHRRPDGRIEKRSLEQDSDVGSALSVLAELPPLMLEQLAVEVDQRRSSPESPTEPVNEMLKAFVAGGVLVGGIDLPSRFTTPWEALDCVSPRLQGHVGRAWENTIRSLREHCEYLSCAIWTLSNEDFVSQLDASRDCILTLCQTAGLPPEVVPAQVLRCDLRLPWRVTLNAAQHRHVLETLNDYDRQWLRGTSPDSATRDILRSKIANQLVKGRSLSESVDLLVYESQVTPPKWPHCQEVDERRVRERLRYWEACLCTPESKVTMDYAGGIADCSVAPTGCFYVGLSGDFALTVGSVADIPTLASSRFALSLEIEGLTDWIRHELSKSISETGISLAELRVPFELNPNVLASPTLLPEGVEPWNVHHRSRSLVGATLTLHKTSGRPVLQLVGSNQPWAVLATGIANTQAMDPLVQLLLLTGFHESPGRNQRAVDVPFASELAQRKFTPQVLLEHGGVLRQRRSLLSKEIPQLVKAQASERFMLWQRIAREMQWPEQLYVSAEGGEPIRVHRDSPLALEALFKGIGEDTSYLAVEAADPEQGMLIPGQGRHVVDIAIPFSRQS